MRRIERQRENEKHRDRERREEEREKREGGENECVKKGLRGKRDRVYLKDLS